MKEFTLEILSPEGRIYKDKVYEATLPTTVGEITVLPGHAPLFTKLSSGEVAIKKGKQVSYITISGGFLEISENNVNVLADFAVRSEKIETEDILEGKRKAENALKQAKDTDAIIAAEKDLRKYAVELKVSDKLRKRRKNR